MQCPSCNYDNLPGADDCDECGASLTREDVPEAHAETPIERSLLEETVQSLHPAKTVHVPQDTPLDVAVRTMREKHLGCLLVTDAEGRLCGILSERDLLNELADREVDLSEHTVAQIMTPNPETVRPDHLLAYALQRMMVGDYRHLPLTDTLGRPVGIISSRDILSYLESQFHQIVSE